MPRAGLLGSAGDGPWPVVLTDLLPEASLCAKGSFRADRRAGEQRACCITESDPHGIVWLCCKLARR